MWGGLSKKQKDQLNYLRAAISCDEKTGLDYLRKTNWDVDRACELHFSEQKSQEKAKPKADAKQVEIYEKYKDKDSEIVDSEGMLQFFKDINVDPLDPTTLVFSSLCGAKTMAEYSKDEFLTGLAQLKAKSIKDVQTAFKGLSSKLENEKEFKEVYRFTFNFAKDPGARNLNFESAKALWNILLSGKFPFLEKWIDFLDNSPNKTDITKDTWNMLLEFHLLTHGNLDNYVDDGAWPVMIDDFVEHLKK